jgi:hypothetical protein
MNVCVCAYMYNAPRTQMGRTATKSAAKGSGVDTKPKKAIAKKAPAAKTTPAAAASAEGAVSIEAWCARDVGATRCVGVDVGSVTWRDTDSTVACVLWGGGGGARSKS